MKLQTTFFGTILLCGALGLLVPANSRAAVSDEDFNQLKNLVTQQGETLKQQNQRIESLEQTHQKDLQIHAEDQAKISDLQKQVIATRLLATNAVSKAEAAMQVQPASPAALAGPAATHNFTMIGDAEFQFGKSGASPNTFVLADFAPIFLFRARDDVLFEAGFDITLQNNARPSDGSGGGSSTHVDLSFAQLDYLFNDYLTFVVGDMVLPLGTYSERAAGWLNKIPDDPMPRDLLPGSGVGAQLRGSVALGENGQMLTYSAWGVNGPSSLDGSGNAGALDLGGNVGDTPNWHTHPSGGARIGWFYPWKAHYDVELGLSGQSGEWDDAGKHLWTAMVLDAAVHVTPNFEAKGEYIRNHYGTDDAGLISQSGWWIQAAYKLAGLNLDWPLVNNLELVGRYDKIKDGLGSKVDRYTVGYVYYFSNTLLFEGDYENFSTAPHNGYVFQLSYGF